MELWEAELWEAIKARNLKQFQKLLANSDYVIPSDINVEYLLLSRAISLNDLEIVQFLLNAGINANVCDDYYTALMYASKVSNLEAVKLLVNFGANVSLANADGNTALLIAAWEGKKDIVQYLSPFYLSDECEYALEILPSGICSKQRREDKHMQAFMEAVQLSNFDAVRTAIANGIDVNTFSEEGQTALYIAAWRGDVEMVRILLQAGADCEIRDEINGWTPLMEAACGAQAEAVKALIDAGADVNAKTEKEGSTALMLAIINHLRDFSYLCFDLRTTDLTLQEQILQTIQELIEKGQNLDEKDNFGNTALMIATAKNLPNIVEILRKAEASEE